MAEKHEMSPQKVLAQDKTLSSWYDLLQQLEQASSNHETTLLKTYSEIDISRTKSTFKYLQQYMYWRENVFSEVAQVPLLSLQVQSENMQILGDAGRDLLRRKEHLKTIASVDKIGSQVEGEFKTITFIVRKFSRLENFANQVIREISRVSMEFNFAN